jgi:hypothetical protein
VRRSLAAGIWLALTVTATLIVWAAVSVVAADVTDRPAPVIAHHDVVVALQRPTTTSVTTSTTAPRVTPSSASPPIANGPATTAAPRSGPPTTKAPTVVPPITVAAPPTTKAPAHPTGPTTTVAPPVGTATYSTAGGIVAVACTGFNAIRLVAALPNDGFQAIVVLPGPLAVQVNFVAAGRNISVSATCFFGQPFEYTKGQSPPASPPST